MTTLEASSSGVSDCSESYPSSTGQFTSQSNKTPMLISKDQDISVMKSIDRSILISKSIVVKDGADISAKCRLPSPGVNSVGESETSDYPRSTPSPGDDSSNIFQLENRQDSSLFKVISKIFMIIRKCTRKSSMIHSASSQSWPAVKICFVLVEK